MRLGDLDALFLQLWRKADPFKEQPSVKPSAVWSEAATLAREAPTIDPETIPVVRQLREELARVKKERDAAVEQLSELECCEFCKHTECIPRGGVGKCEWEWRGPQKDG